MCSSGPRGCDETIAAGNDVEAFGRWLRPRPHVRSQPQDFPVPVTPHPEITNAAPTITICSYPRATIVGVVFGVMCGSGPTIQTMSSLLNEPLSLYLTQLEYDSAGNETPYLFHPTNDTTRCLPSSQWSQTVKAVMKKHAGVATPPKTLRASFVRAALPSKPPSFTLPTPALLPLADYMAS